MPLKANLFATVQIEWTDRLDHEREAEAEVDYTFDGEELTITKIVCDGFDGWNDEIVDELIYDRIADICYSEYADWLADYGEYLSDQAQDRRVA